uniref:Uncharacterized protein n=1 Tax=Aegilops tauschii subsp. strangulata TaxID=200361 RepID=A0A453PDT1_AEGTS
RPACGALQIPAERRRTTAQAHHERRGAKANGGSKRVGEEEEEGASAMGVSLAQAVAELEWGMEADDGVWRKEILMGERCQPLEFSGAIYYDAEGRRLGAPPTPRTPMRSPLPASLKLAANA